MNSFYMFVRILQGSPLSLYFSLCVIVFITNSIFILTVVLFRFFYFFLSQFQQCVFQRIVHFIYVIYFTNMFMVFPYYPFYFGKIRNNIFFFIPDINNLNFFSQSVQQSFAYFIELFQVLIFCFLDISLLLKKILYFNKPTHIRSPYL